ncbi:MAG: hypothetical protein AAGC85_14515, partial [Bacteroidota bacterium]
MKTTISLALAALYVFPTYAQKISLGTSQSPSVERSISGIQIGYPGVWVYHELRLADQFSLRGEIGYVTESLENIELGHVDFNPVISLESRWYYNLRRRDRLGKETRRNSGNFFALATNFKPGPNIYSSSHGK